MLLRRTTKRKMRQRRKKKMKTITQLMMKMKTMGKRSLIRIRQMLKAQIHLKLHLMLLFILTPIVSRP